MAGALAVAGAPVVAAAQPTPFSPQVFQAPALPHAAPQVDPQSPSPQQPSSQPLLEKALPLLRVSAGAGFPFDRSGRALAAFALDITAGAALSFRHSGETRPELAIEACYSHGTEASRGGHFFGIGATPILWLHELLGIGWAPKLVLGATWQGFGVGMRNMLVVPAFAGLLQLEGGHQWLFVEGEHQQEVRVLLGVELVRVLVLTTIAQL